ncbi:MAG: DUF4422 domain-containing protein [Synergistaceae bacterium]|nr:DUF4422 domain-containing protein [Synergistaceae bacterium]
MIKILICCHKATSLPDDDLYLPIQVNSELSKFSLNMEHDNKCLGDKCQNISNLNSIYCEMTAAYWAWKNIRSIYPNLDYIGLCHYRRFFSDIETDKIPKRLFYQRIKAFIKKYIGKRQCYVYDNALCIDSIEVLKSLKVESKLTELIRNSDIVCTEEVVIFNGNVYDFFSQIGKKYLDDLLYIVKSQAPEYYKSLCAVLYGNEIIPANMVVMKMHIFDKYCDFVFRILGAHISMTKKRWTTGNPVDDARYSRVSGYLAEILTCTFLNEHLNDYKVRRVKRIFIKQTG